MNTKKLLFLAVAMSALHGGDERMNLLDNFLGTAQDSHYEYEKIRKRLAEMPTGIYDLACGVSRSSSSEEIKDVAGALELVGEVDPTPSCTARACRLGLEHGVTPKIMACLGWGGLISAEASLCGLFIGLFGGCDDLAIYSVIPFSGCLSCAQSFCICSYCCYKCAFPKLNRPRSMKIKIDDNEIQEEL